MGPMLSLQIKPDWDEIDEVRMKSAAFLREQGLATRAVDALSMVACELTENAVKYGSFEGTSMQDIDIALTLGRAEVTVEVRSPIGEEDTRSVSKLDHMIQWIRGYQDPYEAYLARLLEVSAQSMDVRESGLGLVRIAYEGQSVVDFYVDDQNVVAVSAVYALAAPRAAEVAR